MLFSTRCLLLILFCAILTSCVSKKDVLYFQDIQTLGENTSNINYNTIIRPNDLLSIAVTALDPAVVAPFNPIATTSANARSTNDRLQTYIVDSDGNIEFPMIGTIAIANKTRQEAIEVLKVAIGEYVKNPVINLRILNYTVSVLGEVRNPGAFTIPDERITVLEALGLAGDMTIFGERATVKVIREGENGKTYGELDFTSIDVVNSPYYYLQQNDVVLVSPNGAQIQSSGFNRNSTIFISIAGIIISVIAIFTR